jgi:hypothetical protein
MNKLKDFLFGKKALDAAAKQGENSKPASVKNDDSGYLQNIVNQRMKEETMAKPKIIPGPTKNPLVDTMKKSVPMTKPPFKKSPSGC